MSNVEFLYAFAIGVQTGGRGAIDTATRDLTGALASSDGIVLGDPGSGEGESGISFSLARDLREKAALTGSFTLPQSDFIGTLLNDLSIAVTMKGNGATITGSPADSEYTPLDGYDALLRCAGWSGAGWGAGFGWAYTPASNTPCTVKIWAFDTSGGNSIAIVLMDVEGSWTVSNNPGEVGVMTFALSGSYVSHASVVTPTFNYGTQATLSAPSVQTVGFTWDVTRDFESMAISGDNAIQSVPRSNATAGKLDRQTGRTITLTPTILVDDADVISELDQLQLTSPSVDAMSWIVGTAAGATDTQNAYAFLFPTTEVVDLKPDRSGVDGMYALTMAAKNAAANGEASLIFQ